MRYKIGILTNISLIGNENYPNKLITFNDGHLEIQLVGLIPEIVEYARKDSYYEEPVLYEEEAGTIKIIAQLIDIPVSLERYQFKGLEFICPFYSVNQSSNPGLRDIPIPRSYRNASYFDVDLRLDGNSIIVAPGHESPTELYFSRDESERKEYYFYYYIIVGHLLKRLFIFDDRLGYGDYSDIATSIVKYVDSIRINEILNRLTIKKKGHFIHRIGGDDTYYITREVKMDDEIANKDVYLNKTIGIGEHEVYSISSFSTILYDDIDGNISEEELDAEKQSIIKRYSRDEHISELVSEAVLLRRARRQMHFQHAVRYEQFCDILQHTYHLDILHTGKLRQFIKNQLNNNDLINSISLVNNYLASKTVCSFTWKESLSPPHTKLDWEDFMAIG